MKRHAATAMAAMLAVSIPGLAVAQDAIDGVPIDQIGDSNPRAGEASNQDLGEMPISDLLNALSARGYARYDRIERIGQIYRVSAMTVDFREVVVEIDTVQGTIREIQ